MSQDISVHDNDLVGYSVDAEAKRIVLHTEFRDRSPHEFTDVVFEDVLAYDFQNDTFGTIILDVSETDLDAFLMERGEMFEQGWRYGWPRCWEKEKEAIDVYVRRLGMHAFEISSACGMYGWVIAGKASRIKRERTEDTLINGDGAKLR